MRKYVNGAAVSKGAAGRQTGAAQYGVGVPAHTLQSRESNSSPRTSHAHSREMASAKYTAPSHGSSQQQDARPPESGELRRG